MTAYAKTIDECEPPPVLTPEQHERMTARSMRWQAKRDGKVHTDPPNERASEFRRRKREGKARRKVKST